MNSKQTWDKLLNLKNSSWNEGYTCHKLSFSSMRNSNQPAWPLAPCMASNSLNRFPAWPDWSPKMPFCTCSFTNMMASLKLSQESTEMKKCTLKSCHILEDEHDTWWQKRHRESPGHSCGQDMLHSEEEQERKCRKCILQGLGRVCTTTLLSLSFHRPLKSAAELQARQRIDLQVRSYITMWQVSLHKHYYLLNMSSPPFPLKIYSSINICCCVQIAGCLVLASYLKHSRWIFYIWHHPWTGAQPQQYIIETQQSDIMC